MKNNKLIETLKNLGLSDHESRVYLACLSLGPSTILQIAQAAEVKRTTVYNVIESLKRLGLVRVDIQGFKQLYVADNPEKLEIMVNARRDELINSLPEFMALYNLKGGESFIRYYEGLEACKTVYENIIKEAKYGDFLLVVSDQATWYEQDPEYFQTFLERRSNIGLKVRKLLQYSPKIDELGWGTPKFNEEVKLLPADTQLTTNLFVTPSKVVIHQIIPPILAIEIENNSVVRMNKEMFEIMWGSVHLNNKKEPLGS
ncbi:MAG: Sugar-specific transcriptional regulator TrmB [bacterium ADurb.Bin212]|nr:MAG: Sugar-specific transcriptional regulator TrmB [bacterium ADurb.Bin212]